MEGLKSMNIYEKLSAISLEITAVAKNLTITMGAGKYKAVSEGDVLAAVRPIEAKYRVYSYPCNRKIIDAYEIESLDYKGNIKKQFFERIEITYRFVNMDNTSEFIDIISYGDGIDSGDKSVGKAMTYGDKYALLKAYKIITGEDPDQQASEPYVSKTNKTTATTVAKTEPKKTLSEETIKELNSLGVTLEQVSEYKKIPVEELTDEIVRSIIVAKKKKLAKEKATAVADKPTEVVEKPTTKTDDDFIGE